MHNPLESHVSQTSLREFRKLKELADRALAQVSEQDFFKQIDSESNSLALIVKHMAGNMNSRWRDFLTSDGEKPDRLRDQEFINTETDSRQALMQRWEDGWKLVFSAIESLPNDGLLLNVSIRGEKHTVFQAIARQLTHYGNHVGQIVFLAKHFKEADWNTLSIPRGKSEEFNQTMNQKQG